MMEQLADGVFRLQGHPREAFNCYLVEGVLIDACTRHARRRILRDLRAHKVVGHALTHAHADHQGSSAAVCRALDVPFMCGEKDVPVAESGDTTAELPPHPINRLELRFWAGPGHPVDRPLREGDTLGRFEVLDTPGHSPGHISFWRESDRVLIVGDVLFNRGPLRGASGLHEPPPIFTPDPSTNRASARRLAALRPRVAAFGHGPVLRDPDRLEKFVASLAPA